MKHWEDIADEVRQMYQVVDSMSDSSPEEVKSAVKAKLESLGWAPPPPPPTNQDVAAGKMRECQT